MKVVKPNTLAATDGTFARASSATYFDSSGVLVTATNNVPRFNYNPLNKDFDGIMVESAATNLLLQSADFASATWNKLGTSITSNSTTAPDGTTTADTITNTAGTTSLVFLISSVAASSTNDYFISVFVKKGTSSTFTINTYYDGNAENNITFNLDTLVISGTLPYPSDYLFQNVGGGWFRCGYRIARDGTGTRTSIPTRFWVKERGTGTIGDSMVLWGAQLELGTKATSYIPTTTTTVTRAADVITGAGLIYTTVTDTNAIWNSGTTYALGARVRANYKIYESLQASNLNKPPATEPTWWLEIGPDNMHAAFDTQISTVSTSTTKMTFVVKAGLVDAIALINMQAVTARVTVYDQASNTYERRVAGLTGAEVYDWYQYFFFDPLIKRTQVVFTELPSFTNALITVELEGNPSEIVSIAQAIFGVSEELGGTQYGATAGIVDYSVKSTDDFGTVTFVRRNFSKRLSTQIFIENARLNRVQRFLYDVRATPLVWVGSDSPELEEAVVVYGFYKEFSTDIAYPNHSLCSLEIEGLT